MGNPKKIELEITKDDIRLALKIFYEEGKISELEYERALGRLPSLVLDES